LNCLKFRYFMFVFLGSTMAIAQTGTAPAASPTPSQSAPTSGKTVSPAVTPGAGEQAAQQPPPSLVPETAPVITINGVCEISPSGTPKAPMHTAAGAKTAAAGAHAASASPSSSSSDCKTQITRAEFEKLMKTVAPGAPAQARRQIASRYVQFLTAANEGVKLGVDKEPEFNEQLALMRLQLLGQDAEKKLQSQASNVSDSEMKTYYDQNSSAFEEVTLTRVLVPRVQPDPKSTDPAPDGKAIADNARQQLMIGGDPEKIEKGIYDQLKNTNPPPSTKFGARRHGSMPAPQEEKIFAMKDGEITEVMPDPSGFVIYRVDEKKQLAFEDVKEDVKQRIVRQRMGDVREKITNASKADFNDAYFGPEAASPKMGTPGVPPTGSRPPAGSPGAASTPADTSHSQPSSSAPPK
jgi:parvulin-like peptidyl-prolyl isomerase